MPNSLIPRTPIINPLTQQLDPVWLRFFADLETTLRGVIDLTSDVAGVLPVANGGTGTTSGLTNLVNANVGAGAAIAWSKISKTGSTLTDFTTRAASDLSTVRTSYTPSWTGSVSDPSLGNGTLTGASVRVGGALRIDIALTIGSTTTIGSGVWSFTLPGSSVGGSIGPALVYDASGPSWAYGGSSVILTASTCGVIVPGVGQVGSASPLTWATGDSLVFSVTEDLS